MTTLAHPGAPATGETAPVIVVRYWAAARAAAGADEEIYPAGTVGVALRKAHARHADRPHFARVLATCSLLVDGQRVHLDEADHHPLVHGTTVEVLPPFAGG